MFDILDFTKDTLIAFEVKGKLEKKDYEKLSSLLEKTEREHEKLKLFIMIGELQGITLPALLDDIKTYFTHIGKVKKVAIVGRSAIDKSLTKVTDLFTSAEIKYYPKEEYEIAKSWILT